jgi:predicted lipid-binding transport protein (Tim44 family)
MKQFLIGLFAVFVGFGLTAQDVEAKRLGGSKSFGMQRTAPAKQDAAPAPQRQQDAPASPSATPQKGSWMGPVAGLAAGLGLAALFSHLGLGEEMASFLMLVLLAMAAFLLFRFFMRRNAPRMQYAGVPGGNVNQNRPVAFEALQPVAAGGTRSSPPGFDAEAFARQAKVNFLRLQAANDAGNLGDLRAFTTPEVFAELSMQITERGPNEQKTDVQWLDAEVLECADDADRHIVSVRFTGEISESAGSAPVALDEIWHLVKPAKGPGGWVVAGIQQA